MPDFTAMIFVQILMSLYVGGLITYTSKIIRIMEIVSGFVLAYVLVVETSEFWLGLVHDNDLSDYAEWLLMLAVLLSALGSECLVSYFQISSTY